MMDMLKLIGGLLVGLFRSHASREAEIMFLRAISPMLAVIAIFPLQDREIVIGS
jgi:uncharacterized membrane protein YdcZ (DUF606 family)